MPPELLDVPSQHDGASVTAASSDGLGEPAFEVPTMEDLDRLVSELDEIDATLSQLG